MATQVILQMNVHCNGCARKIRSTARTVNGVEEVWASPETGVVVVAGNVDVEALRSRIEHATRRPVTVVSDGAKEAPSRRAPSSMVVPVDRRRRAPPPQSFRQPAYAYDDAGRLRNR
ncbi:hypothetical protein QOZ80_3BG0263050 [Eleusine coracana subsp. coracana]|nr:hypothetical protein QOZ80_3BG0263050 [Eleusine coracana subsp. coracana]